MSVAGFYAESRVRDRFMQRDGKHGQHRGVDFAHAPGTPVPSWCAGTVVTVRYSSAIGWCIEVARDGGGIAGWAHNRNVQVRVGDRVAIGTNMAEVAGRDDDPGTSWLGPHSHVTFGLNRGSIFEGQVLDPLPYIQAATPAGGDTDPLDPEHDEEDEMMKYAQFHYAASDGKKRRIAVAFGTAWFMEWTDNAEADLANALSVAAFGPSIATTESVRNELVAAAERCVASPDALVAQPAPFRFEGTAAPTS